MRLPRRPGARWFDSDPKPIEAHGERRIRTFTDSKGRLWHVSDGPSETDPTIVRAGEISL